MAYGPGVYDDIATDVRLKTNATTVVVIILGGNKGDGFAVQTNPSIVSPSRLAAMLHATADEITRSGS